MTDNSNSVSNMNKKDDDSVSVAAYGYDDVPQDIHEFNDIIQRSVTNNPNDNVLTRLSTLSRTLSGKNAKEMAEFHLDEHDLDLEKILKYLVQFNSSKGYEMKEVDVIFKDLTVVGKNTAASVLKDVSDALLPPLAIAYNAHQKRKHPSPYKLEDLPKTRKIIKDVTGYLAPGTLTMVLGRPGAGCSTMLKALAGETQTYLGVEGILNYNGVDFNDMNKLLSNLLIYNPELDEHFPYLTVEETLKFAISCKTPTIRVENKSRSEYISNMKDLYEILFGLKHVEKTLVGNDFIRGISGGQRKRVSIAEAMVTAGSVYCYDNATRGLDASTALEFVQALRTSTNIYRTSSVVTLYQASENIYELFDNVTVLYLGRQVYFGPTNKAVEYFENLGYVKHPRQTTPEFLTAITDPNARIVNEELAQKQRIPDTADEFEASWKASNEYAEMQAVIDQLNMRHTDVDTSLKQLKESHQLIKQKHTSKNSVYTVNYNTQFKNCIKRRFQILNNNRSYAITSVSAALIQALVVGSLMYNTTNETIGAFSRGGALFFAVLYFAIMELAEVPATFEEKPILNKQYGYNLFHPSAELLAKQAVHFTVNLLSIIVFAIVLYFLTSLKMDAGAFFQFLLFLIMIVQAYSSCFAMLSAIMPNAGAATGICGITMMAMMLYGSYMIQRPSMYWWFKWFSYCNPVLYAFESMILMQFRGFKMPCSPFQLIPNGPGYENIDTVKNQVCGFVGAAESKAMYNGANDVSGEVYLKLSFTYTFGHAWRNLGIMFAFLIGYLVIACVIVENFNPIEASSDQLLFVKNARITKRMYEYFRLIAAEDSESVDVEKNAESEDDDDVIIPNKEDEGTSDDNSSNHKLGSEDIFTWQKVNYVVPYEGADRKLLDDVQGYVLPGTLTALMGESGAGKTTLLNVLSRRTDVGVVTGDMLINGNPMGTSFERRTGYVQQQDLHISQLTVRESLLFSARLRRPKSVPDAEKVEYVDMVMKILHMSDYADSIAGVSGFGLNVEQRKKLSIATELVAKPSLLLFLDEPTSGLDSQSSWAIVQVLKKLAAAGQAILCTIHQPSATLFEQFDRLLLLRKGGQTVYFGDIGKDSRTVIDYFERNGGRDCGAGENPAEYILEVIGAGATASATQNWFEAWQNSPEYGNVTREIADLLERGKTIESEGHHEELESTYATSYSYQMYQVQKRTFTQTFRSLHYIMPKFFLTLLAGLLVGFTFWNVKHTVIGMQNLMFAAFLTIVVSAPLMNQIQTEAVASRELFEVRESKSNTFHWSCLLLSHYCVEIPYAIAFSTIYFIAWYFPVQLDNSPNHAGFWWFTYCIFFQLYYPSFALMVLYPAPDLASANILMGLFFNFSVSFCGVLQRPNLMPGFWKFMWRTSPLTYFVGNELSVLLHDRPVVCSETEYNYLQPPSGLTCGDFLEDYFKTNTGYVNNPNATSDCAVCQYSVGDDYLESIGVFYGDRWRNIGLFCAYIIFNLFLMNSLYYVFRVKRWSPFSLVQNFTSKFQKKK